MIRPSFCLLPLEYSLNRREGSRSRRSTSEALYAGSTPPRRFPKYSIVWPPVSRSERVEQGPDGGRLAGAVRPQEAEHLALVGLQVEVDDAPAGAVGLGQSLGLDDGGHADLPWSAAVASTNHSRSTVVRLANSSDPGRTPRIRSKAS